MRIKIIFSVLMVLVFSMFLPSVHATSSVNIIMEKTVYSYCEKLFYTIEVSEITGEQAIIHIRDETGKGSSAIPIPITQLQTPIPSRVAFSEEIFPLGKYFIDVKYGNAEFTSEFVLIESNKTCIPEVIKPILSNWISGTISDGFLVGAFQKYIDKKIIEVPFEINENNVYNIVIPEWVKNTGYWWLGESITDEEFANAINYLINKKIISIPNEIKSEI